MGFSISGTTRSTLGGSLSSSYKRSGICSYRRGHVNIIHASITRPCVIVSRYMISSQSSLTFATNISDSILIAGTQYKPTS